jgi:hypothetical protein
MEREILIDVETYEQLEELGKASNMTPDKVAEKLMERHIKQATAKPC